MGRSKTWLKASIGCAVALSAAGLWGSAPWSAERTNVVQRTLPLLPQTNDGTVTIKVSAGEPTYELYRAEQDHASLSNLILTNSYVLWTEKLGEIVELLRRPRLGGVAQGMSYVPAGAVAADSAYLYWVNRQHVWRGSLMGGMPEQVCRGNGRLVLGDERVYVLTRGGIISSPKEGGDVRALGERTRDYLPGRAVAAGHVVYYMGVTWKAGDRTRPYSSVVAIDDAGSRTLVSEFPEPGAGLQVSGDYVYYLAQGQLHRVHKDKGGDAQALFDPAWRLKRFAVDGDTVFAVGHLEGPGVFAMDLRTGTLDRLSTYSAHEPQTLAVDATHVYWDRGPALVRARR